MDWGGTAVWQEEVTRESRPPAQETSMSSESAQASSHTDTFHKWGNTSGHPRLYCQGDGITVFVMGSLCLYSHLASHSAAAAAAAAAKSLQSCLNLCFLRDSSPPGSPIPGNLQTRTLEWVASSFSNAWKWKVKVKSLSHVRHSATPWTAAYQAPPSMGFSRQEYSSGVPLPSPGTSPSSL